jgi:putative ABC transport system substrate-binding protein
LPGGFTDAHNDVIAAAAARYRIPVIGALVAKTGGLVSYYFNLADIYVQSASYIDRILKGAKPGDLPVQQPTKYSLIISLKTAKTLGLIVPSGLLAQADEIIE